MFSGERTANKIARLVSKGIEIMGDWVITQNDIRYVVYKETKKSLFTISSSGQKVIFDRKNLVITLRQGYYDVIRK